MLNGIYTWDKDSMANGCPHYVNENGQHLYVMADGKWGVSAKFEPSKSLCIACVPAKGLVPTGPTTWLYSKGSGINGIAGFSDRTLTVTELSGAGVESERAAAAAARAAALEEGLAQGARAGGLQVSKPPSWPPKSGQLQPFLVVFPQECTGQLVSLGPT